MKNQELTTFGYKSNTSFCVATFGYVCKEREPIKKDLEIEELLIEQYKKEYKNG